jgi:hypothetical protein
MRFPIFLLLSFFVVTSCSSVKRSQKLAAKGEYDKAIDLAVKKLQKNRRSKDADAHIGILVDAFKKATEDDLRQISFYKKEKSQVGIRETYFIYVNMEERQQKIRPLLPLHYQNGRAAKLKMADYTNEIIAAKNNYVASLYGQAEDFMRRNNKQDYRNAHHVLMQLNTISPNYKDVRNMLDEAHFKGTDFILVKLNNHTAQIIPSRLQDELLDFNTYGLNDLWTEYHGQRDRQINYDFGIDMNFKIIDILPERITEQIFTREASVKDGETTLRDRGGNIVRDSLGNPVKIDRMIDVKATVKITTQQKNVLVGGTVVYRDLSRKQQMQNFPLSTEFIFENIFATYRGDKRALTTEDLELIRNRFVPFPSNEQMVLDAGDDIKYQLKQILSKNKFN